MPKICTLQLTLHAPCLFTCLCEARAGSVFTQKAQQRRDLPGRTSGSLRWLRCGFSRGRRARCSCIASEGTGGRTPAGASPSLSGGTTKSSKRRKTRGWELGITVVLSPCPSLSSKTHLSLQSRKKETLFSGFSSYFVKFYSYNFWTEESSTLKCIFWMLSPLQSQLLVSLLLQRAVSKRARGKFSCLHNLKGLTSASASQICSQARFSR